MEASDLSQEQGNHSHYRNRQRPWRRRVRGYLLLPHLVPVLAVELATAAFSCIAWGGIPPFHLLMPLLLAMLGGQLAVGATNELVDLPFDAVGKPAKPLPSGDVSIREARMMVFVGLIIMIVFGLRFNLPAFALLALGTGLGVAYDLWFKRTAWSWLPYLLALPLLPIWVFTALGKPEPGLLLLYPLGALAAVGVHLAQALPDVAIDREAGLRTVTSRFGGLRTFVFAWLATLSAPILAWYAAGWFDFDQSGSPIVLAGMFALIALVINVILIIADHRIGMNACFALVVLATLGSGVAWSLTVGR